MVEIGMRLPLLLLRHLQVVVGGRPRPLPANSFLRGAFLFYDRLRFYFWFNVGGGGERAVDLGEDSILRILFIELGQQPFLDLLGADEGLIGHPIFLEPASKGRYLSA